VQRTIPVLLAADTPEDALLTRRAFRLCGIPAIVDVVTDAEEAIDYLEGKGKFAKRSIFPLPELILLDIKEEQGCALELLKWLKGNSRFQAIPAAILSSVDVPQIITKAYALGAVACLGKPADVSALERLLKVVHAVSGPRQAVAPAAGHRPVRMWLASE